MCPSIIVDASMEPRPMVSSSFILTSSTSNKNTTAFTGDAISRLSSSTSTSLLKTRKLMPLTYFHHSSIGQSDDFYTNKRIDDLHERLDELQINSFLKFLNHHLPSKSKPIEMKDFEKDLSNGQIWIDLIEALSSQKLSRERGRTRFHALANVEHVVNYLKSRIAHVQISPQKIVNGDRKQILALLWSIMKTFNFPDFHLTSNRNIFLEKTIFGFGQDRSAVIYWLNHLLNKYYQTEQLYIEDFYLKSWLSTCYLLIIIKYLFPISQVYLNVKSYDYFRLIEDPLLSDQQRFVQCLKLSNYAFNTISQIDFNDKTERSLFRYFSEFQMNVVNGLNTERIRLVNEANPYVKQLIESIVPPTKIDFSSSIIHRQEYLVAVEKSHVPETNERTTSIINEVDEHQRANVSNVDASTTIPLGQENETLSHVDQQTLPIEQFADEPQIVDLDIVSIATESTNVPDVSDDSGFNSKDFSLVIQSFDESNDNTENDEVDHSASDLSNESILLITPDETGFDCDSSIPLENSVGTMKPPPDSTTQTMNSTEEEPFLQKKSNEFEESHSFNIDSIPLSSVNGVEFHVDDKFTSDEKNTGKHDDDSDGIEFHTEGEELNVESINGIADEKQEDLNLENADINTSASIENLELQVDQENTKTIEDEELSSLSANIDLNPIESTTINLQLHENTKYEENLGLESVSVSSEIPLSTMNDVEKHFEQEEEEEEATSSNDENICSTNIKFNPTSVSSNMLESSFDQQTKSVVSSDPIQSELKPIELNQVEESAITSKLFESQTRENEKQSAKIVARTNLGLDQSSTVKQAYSSVVKKNFSSRTIEPTVEVPTKRIHQVSMTKTIPIASPCQEESLTAAKSKSRRKNRKNQNKPIVKQLQPDLLVLPSSTEQIEKEEEIQPKSEKNFSPERRVTVQKRQNNKKKVKKSEVHEKSVPTNLTTSIATETAPMIHRNLFVLVKEYICDPRLTALKYVFFLFCFCFTLVIVFLQQ